MDRIKQILFFIIGLLVAIQPIMSWAQAPAGAVITNTAYVSYDDGAGGALTLPSDTVVTNIEGIEGGSLYVTKSADKTEVALGDTLAYEVLVYNRGKSNLIHIIVKDTLPEMLSLLSSQPSGTVNHQVVTWEIQSLNAGESTKITVNCKVVKANYRPAIENWATGVSNNGDPVRSDTSVVSWLPWPEAELKKSVTPTQVYYGDTLTFTLRVTNTGFVPLVNPLVRDSIPKGVLFIDADHPVTTNGQILMWPLDPLGVGEISILTYRAVVTRDASGTLSTFAALSTVEGASDTASVEIVVRGHGAGIEIIKEAQQTVYMAENTITYDLILSNSGQRAAQSIVVHDTLPDHLQFLDATHDATHIDNIVQWNLGDLEAGYHDTLRVTTAIRLPIDDQTPINNEVWADASFGARDSSNWEVLILSLSDASFTKTVDQTYSYVGDTLTYTLVVKNLGTTLLNQIQVTDSLPEGMDFLSASLPVTHNNGVITWNIDHLDYQSTLELELKTLVLESMAIDSVVNNASLQCNEGVVKTASVSIQHLGHGAGIEIIKEAIDSVFRAGDSITYDLILTSGIQMDHDITVKDTLPHDMQYLSSTHGGTILSNIVTWNIRGLRNGYHDTLRVTTIIQPPIDDNRIVNNEVWAYSNVGPQDSSNWEIRVISKPTVQLDLDVDPSYCLFGDTLTYTLTAHNTGTMHLTNTQITDTLVHGLQFVDCDLPTDTTNGLLTWNLGNLNYQEIRTFKFRALVTEDAPIDTLWNHASITTAQGVSDPADAAIPMLGSGVGIEIIKEAADSVYNAGDTLIYDLILSNGGFRSSQVVICDTLPEYLEYVSSTHEGRVEGNIVIWNLNEFEPGYHDTLRVTTAIRIPIEDKTVVNNEVWAYAKGAQDSSNWRITVNSEPDLQLEVQGPSIASPGDTIRYMLILSNRGTATAFEPVLTDTIPELLKFIDASGTFMYLPKANAVHWYLPAMAPGDIDTLYLYTRILDSVTPNDKIINSAWLSYKLASRAATATCITETVPKGQSLYTYKRVDRARASAGDTLLYTIYYGALHRDIEDTLHIIDHLPDEVEWIDQGVLSKSSAQLVAYDPVLNCVNFMQGTLKKGEEDSLIFRTRIRNTLNPGEKWIENQASIHTHADTVQTVDDPRTRSKTLLVAPFLEVKKTVNRKVTQVGDVLTYTVSIQNKSNITPVSQIIIDDLLPKGFRYQKGASILDSVKISDPAFSQSGKRIHMQWTLRDSLQPSQTMRLKYRIIVGLDVKQGEHKNLVIASGITPSGVRIYSEQAEAAVLVHQGAFDERGFIFGKVYEDMNQNGLHDNAEPKFKDIELIMEDGTHVKTDDYGKYSIPDVEHGQHVLRLNENTLPKDKRVIANEIEFLDDPKSRLIIVPPGGMTKANFVVETIE